MISISKFAALSTAAIVLTACDGTWETDNTPKPTTATEKKVEAAKQATLEKVTPGQVVLHSGDIAGQNYTVIQDIKVSVNKTTAFHPSPTVEAVQAKLKNSAAKIGGNAVTNVNISDVKVSGFSWGTRTGTGTVVKTK